MTRQISHITISLLLLALFFLAGFWWAGGLQMNMNMDMNMDMNQTGNMDPEREVLYWYDPMVPQQHFDQPGQSPFMDMALIPRYADEVDSAAIQLDPGRIQALGMRLATAREISYQTEISASGVLQFNRRQQADVQLRTGGFVEQLSPLAEGDQVSRGQLLAELTLPAWTAAQQEFLSVLAMQDPVLLQLARERLLLLGMTPEHIQELESDGQARFRFRITAPISGVIEQFNVSIGMSLDQGAKLARIVNNDVLWLEVAVPERYAGLLAPGDHALVQLNSPETESLHGSVETVLPMIDPATRTLRVRITLPNPGHRLQAGLSAQVYLQAGDLLTGIAVPTEALIRTGQRSLLMLADSSSRFRPIEVTPGRETGAETIILSGLSAGQQVVASGQFLLDSEASLLGVGASSPDMPSAEPAANAAPADNHDHDNATTDSTDSTTGDIQ
ncbi:MAG: efflux RND transporter periplasmic adaptor subunit [Pseudomonadales bacterium]|nr:efflux RND transporter periplasmic adaptor subunit [Pseudomonadales bacterium]